MIDPNPNLDLSEILEVPHAEPLAPPSPLGPTLLYKLQVALKWESKIWRHIEMRGDQTLHDLHQIIQEAFEWDNDHLYAFFLSGKRWDQRTEYVSPWAEEGRRADLYRLESLKLHPGKEFLYLFDFGDQLEHLIKVEETIPGGVIKGQTYPRITEALGDPIPQYPSWDEEDDEEWDEEEE